MKVNETILLPADSYLTFLTSSPSTLRPQFYSQILIRSVRIISRLVMQRIMSRRQSYAVTSRILRKCSAATQTSTHFHLTPVECYSRTFSFMSPVECKCNSRTSKIQCPLLNATHVHSEESVVPILMLGHCSHASHSHAFDVLQIRAIDLNNT